MNIYSSIYLVKGIESLILYLFSTISLSKVIFLTNQYFINILNWILSCTVWNPFHIINEPDTIVYPLYYYVYYNHLLGDQYY